MDRTRIQAYLQAACAALNFDIGEIWCCNDAGRVADKSELHFIQLYTSPAYCDYRTKLVTPSDDWESHKDVNKHRFSPLICEAVRDGGQIVWANTTVEEGLLGRSDLPLRTAVGAPVCNVGVDLCILVMFSPCILPNTPEAMEFLYTMAQAAADVMCGFLPASASHPIRHVLQSGADALCDHHRSRAIIDALPKTISFQTWALQQVPLFAGYLRRGDTAAAGAAAAGNAVAVRGVGNGGGGSNRRSSLNLSGFGSMLELSGVLGEEQQSLPPPPGSPQLNDCFGLDDMGFNLDDDLLIWSTVMDGHGGAAASPTAAGAASAPAAAGAAPGAAAGAAGGGGGGGGGASSGAGSSSQTPGSVWEREGEADAAAAAAAAAAAEVDGMAVVADELETPPQTPPPPAAVLTAASPPRPPPTPPEAAAACGLVLLPRAPRPALPLPPAPASADGGGCFFEDPFTRARFEEFIRGFLAMSVFHAADCWLPNAGDTLFLACSSVQDASLVKWTSYSSSVTFTGGVGMPGRIFATQASLWQTEYAKVDPDQNPLCHIAGVLGIHTAFGVPIPVGNGKAGVIMFYSMSTLPTSELMLGFVERAVRLLLGDLPSIICRAANLGRVAGAYRHHAKWQEQSAAVQQQQQQLQRLQGAADPLSAAAMAAAGLRNASSSLAALHRFSTGGSPAAVAATAAAAAAAAASLGLGLAPSMSPPPPPPPLSSELLQGPLDLGPAPEAGGGSAASNAYELPPLQAMPAMPPLLVKQELSAAYGQALHAEGGPLAGGQLPPDGGSAPACEPSNGYYGGSNGSERGDSGYGSSSDGDGDGHSSAGGGSSVCRMDGCERATARRLPFCPAHAGSRHCAHPGCNKCAQGSTKYCIAHGGGRRCTFPGCNKGARDKFFCAAHGGGKRCTTDGCTKAAVGGSSLCTAHGGGRRCQFPACTKSAQSSTNFCVRHGGGRKCQVPNCQKVARGRTRFCAAHGGGIRCRVDGCNKAAVGKQQMCRTHSGEPAPAGALSPVGDKRALELDEEDVGDVKLPHKRAAA